MTDDHESRGALAGQTPVPPVPVHRAAGTGELLAEWPNQITMYRDDEDLIARWREAVKSGRVIVLDSRSTRRRWWHRLQPRWWR